MRKEEIQALKSALQEQLGLYKQMLEVSKSQKDNITDLDFLFDSLNKKQEIIFKVQDIDNKIADLKEYWKVSKSKLSLAERTEIENLFDQIQLVLQELLSMEGILAEEVKLNQKELETELSQISTGKKAIKAYYKKVGRNEARFVDRKQ